MWVPSDDLSEYPLRVGCVAAYIYLGLHRYHPHYGDLPPRVHKDFIAPVHVAFASPIYRLWSEAQLAQARHILPELHGHVILGEDDMDEDNHSLDSFDRSPRLERFTGATS